MPLKDIIAAAYNSNAAAFETALNTELQSRMAAAVRSKYVSEAKDSDEDEMDDEEDEDEMDDEEDEDEMDDEDMKGNGK